jgi:biotin transport system substrate-specific component
MKITIKQMTLVALFAALTAAGAFIQIPLGTVPVTLQFMFTALSGIMLGAKLGALSQFIYVLIGLIGLPVFAGGTGGFEVVYKPSFGYLMGFIIGAYVIGKISESRQRPGFAVLFLAALAGIGVIYAVGVPYMYFIIKNVIGKDIGFAAVLKIGFIIFIPGVLIKCIIAAALGKRVLPVIKKEGLG